MEAGFESKAIICESSDQDSFTVKTLNVKRPNNGQVLVRMKYATFSVHDNLHNGYDKNAEYPHLAGYDGVGTVEEVGEGVEEFDKGDHVAVFMVPGNRNLSDKTNISDEHAKVLNKGGFWKLSSHLEAYSEDKSIGGFRGVGTWSQLAVFPLGHLMKLDHEPEIADAGLGSFLATGLLSPDKVLQVDEGANIAVFGSNSVALTLVSSLKSKKPESIVVIGAKEDQELFEKMGAKYLVDEGEVKDIQSKLMELSSCGYDFTFETTSYKKFGTPALEICHKGWGKAALLTPATEKDETITTRPFQLVTGRHWVGSYMGNVNIGKDHEALKEAHKNITKEVAEHILPADHVVSIDDFPSKWKELSTTATYHRTIIEF